MAHGMNGMWTTNSHCETLLKVATPELYRYNAFRVFGLPVTVTPQEIERRRRKLQMIAKWGIDSTDESGGCLPLDPPPDEDSVGRAVERLRDPEKRVIDEFFWFWPGKNGLFGDEALGLLSKNCVNEALDIWNKNAEGDSSGITAHNIAVLYHVHALDIEHKSITQPLTEEELETCGLCWKGAYKEWQKLLENEKFWSQVTARIRDLNDLRLTTGIARRIRHSLPKAIIQINARLARRAAEKNDEATCNYHIKLVNEFGFDKKAFNTVLREEVVSIRQRVKIICGSIEKISHKNQEHADVLIWEFLLEAKSLLKTIDQLLPEDDIVRDNAHDEIAKRAKESAITYVNTTEDWKEGVKLLLQAFHIAASKPLRAGIKKNLDTANYYAEQEQESVAFKLAEAEKKKSVSYAHKSIKVKCSLAREEAESNPESADKAIWQLLLETKPLLQNLKALRSDDNPLLNSAKDEIADTVILCQMSYGNRTKNWKQCVILLMSAYEIATSESLHTRLKDNIKRLNENLRQEQGYEELKKFKTEDHAFVVSVSGTIATIPSVCVCCLGKAENKQRISNSWGEDAYSRHKNRRSFTFPLCRACKNHQAELLRKRVIWILLVAVLPVVVSYVLGLNMGRIPYLDFLLVGTIISTFVFLMLVLLLRLPKLSEKHASRCAAVSLDSVGAGYSTFRFWNHFYAHAFAQANNSQVKVKKVLRYARDPYLVRGRSFFRRIGWIIALAFIGHSIVFAILSGQWDYSRVYSNPTYRPPEYTTTTEENGKPETEAKIEAEVKVEAEENDTRYSLIAQINDGKARLQKIETELEQLYAQIKALSSEMESLQATIKELDLQKDRIGDLEGFLENTGEYNQAINRHEELNKQHNSLQSKYRSGYSVYEKELKKVNDMIEQYNRGAR